MLRLHLFMNVRATESSESPFTPLALSHAIVLYRAIAALAQKRGTPITRIPTLGHNELDLYALYHAIIKRGGVETVITNKGWRQVAESLRLPASCTDSGFRLKLHYCSYLYPYERRFFLDLDDEIPPSLMPVSLSSSSSSSCTRIAGSSPRGHRPSAAHVVSARCALADVRVRSLAKVKTNEWRKQLAHSSTSSSISGSEEPRRRCKRVYTALQLDSQVAAAGSTRLRCSNPTRWM